MNINQEIQILYKRETGREPADSEFSVYRSKGRWIIDENDEDIIKALGGIDEWMKKGTILIPDQDYISWLEEMV